MDREGEDGAGVVEEVPGLIVVLDKLVYQRPGAAVPAETPHAFVYHLTIRNDSQRTVRLVGRKWIVEHADGRRQVLEGDGIVGETPVLAPGVTFSYQSFHLVPGEAVAHGAFHGVDAEGRRVWVRIPVFALRVPEAL